MPQVALYLDIDKSMDIFGRPVCLTNIGKGMKYILIFLISLTSHLSLASYHEGEGSSSGSGGGGYGGGSDAIAYVGVGVLVYFLLRNKDSEENEESSLSNISFDQESKLEIDFLRDNFNSFSKTTSEFNNPTTKFQINLRYKLN